MGRPARRTLPDNLDPLVDTLANVVGILVIVIVLTQLDLSDALTRVVGLAGSAALGAEAAAAVDADLDGRESALRARTDLDAPDAARLAEDLLEALATLSAEALQGGEAPEPEPGAIERLEAELTAARAAARRRAEHAGALEKVPERLVARIPDPRVERAQESWVLVRYGRVFPVDREQLFEAGTTAISRILPDGYGRQVRPDEFEAISLYLQKRNVGLHPFRWQLRTEPNVRVELEWVTRDAGIEHTRLASDPTWRAWLAARAPEREIIFFQVWADSFETYLEARQAVEAAGLRAGWRAHEADEELELNLVFGVRTPDERAVEVD